MNTEPAMTMLKRHPTMLFVPALYLGLLPMGQATAGLSVDNDAAFPDNAEVVGATPAEAVERVRLDVTHKPRSNNRADIVAGQSFTPRKTFKLDKVFIEYAQATDGQPIRLSIQAIDNIDTATYKQGDNLLSEEAVYTFSAANGDVSEDERVLGLDLTGDDEITLEQGKAYVFEIITGNDDGTIDFRWTRTASAQPTESPGRAYIDRQQVVFKEDNFSDFSFAIVAKQD